MTSPSSTPHSKNVTIINRTEEMGCVSLVALGAGLIPIDLRERFRTAYAALSKTPDRFGGGCAVFAREGRAPRGTCRPGGPAAGVNNDGVPISRHGMWPTLSETQFCGTVAAQIGEAA